MAKYSEVKNEKLKKLRFKSGVFQALAVLFILTGLGLHIFVLVEHSQNLYLALTTLALFILGISFQVAALIHFRKAKKHLQVK